MPIKLSAAFAAVGLCLIGGVAQAANTTSWQWTVNLLRGSTTVSASDCSAKGTTEAAAWAACEACITRLTTASARTSGADVYTCQTPRRQAIVTYTCPPAPASQTRTQTCPAGTTGTWTQTSSSVVTPITCVVTTSWAPTSPPAGACPPVPVEPTGTATLSWTPPTQNTNGSTLTNLTGYRISYGTTEALAQTIQLASPGTSRYTIEGLAPGTYHFAVRAYTSTGTESVNSNVVSKTVQ